SHHLVGRHVYELGVLVDELLDEPRARDAIHARVFTGDPLHSANDDGSRAIKRGVRRRLDLRAEDDERAQREHPEQREERRRDRPRRRSSAAEPESAEATNIPPSAQPASLHTAWFDTARSTPVYAHTNRPKAVPIAFHTSPKPPRSMRAIAFVARNQPTSAMAPRNETKEKRPKARSAHEPRLMGESGLNASPPPGLVSTSMCQKRSGCPRSSVRKIGHGMSATKL